MIDDWESLQRGFDGGYPPCDAIQVASGEELDEEIWVNLELEARMEERLEA